ncbi:YadA-like family protein [Psychrobacter fulvigenes]|uniref:YadA-like family protein n=1 Tax=Psychrobacter fulvigenes TaxID=533323 RepID=UPI001919C3E8|nr:YadA-like family protein [Psychrobacter fulvigenes]
MNRNYKVIWNNALNCFTAVAEYAKARGKSSKSSVSSNARINTTSKHSSTGILRSSAIGIGMMVAGFGIQANAAPPVPLCVGMTSVECGINANANPYYAIAIGKHAQADGVLSTAVGTHARSKGVASSAFGAGAFATEHGSVALGAGSRTDSAATSEKVMTVGGETYKIAGNVLYHNNTLMPGAQVSVGSAGFERQIKNVAGGKVSKTSTDAVNGSQLHATNTTINRGIKFNVNDTHKKTFALGEEIKLDTDANLTTTPLSTNDGIKLALNDVVNIGTAQPITIDGTEGTISGLTNTTFNQDMAYQGGQAATQEQLSQVNTNISTTIDKGLSFTGDDTNIVVNRKLGKTLSIKGGATELTENNIGVVADEDGNLNIKLAENIALGADGSFTIGNTLINQSGFTFISEGGSEKTVMLSSSGLNNGGNRITNVARATEGTDAVNFDQLNEVRDSATSANQGFNISAQGENKSTVRPGDSVDFNNQDGNVVVSKEADSNNISFDLNQNVNLDSATFGDVVVSANGLNNGGKKITNVGNGTVAAGSSDAITGDQLNSNADSITNVIGGNAVNNGGVITTTDIGGTGQNTIDGAIGSIQQGVTNTNAQVTTNTTNIANNTNRLDGGLNFGADNGNNINKPIGDDSVLGFVGGNNITTTTVGSSIRFDLNGNINVDSVTTGSVVAGNTTVNNNGVTIAGGPSMTVDGINMRDKVITGVADGVKDTDAVNRGQLNNQFDTIDRLINSELANMDSKLDDRVNSLGYRIDDVEDDANAGISAAMAMSSLPQAYIPGKSMIGGGIASYNGESAVAIGVSRVSDNGRWVMKINGTADTQGNAGGAIGAGFHF